MGHWGAGGRRGRVHAGDMERQRLLSSSIGCITGLHLFHQLLDVRDLQHVIVSPSPPNSILPPRTCTNGTTLEPLHNTTDPESKRGTFDWIRVKSTNGPKTQTWWYLSKSRSIATRCGDFSGPPTPRRPGRSFGGTTSPASFRARLISLSRCRFALRFSRRFCTCDRIGVSRLGGKLASGEV